MRFYDRTQKDTMQKDLTIPLYKWHAIVIVWKDFLRYCVSKRKVVSHLVQKTLVMIKHKRHSVDRSQNPWVLLLTSVYYDHDPWVSLFVKSVHEDQFHEDSLDFKKIMDGWLTIHKIKWMNLDPPIFFVIDELHGFIVDGFICHS